MSKMILVHKEAIRELLQRLSKSKVHKEGSTYATLTKDYYAAVLMGRIKDENAALKAEVERLKKDETMLDWLSDPKQSIGNVQLPTRCVQNNLHSLRDAIAEAMKETK
ncbi:MAG: hypothetical protein ABI216_21835 [Devosia sp.]